MTTATSKCYLSGSDATGWTIIVDEMPICADKHTRQEAMVAAIWFHLTPTHYWDGSTFTKL